MVQEAEEIEVHARMEDAFAFHGLVGMAAPRYERAFAAWLRELGGQILPASIGEDAGAAIDNDGLPETGLDTPRRDDLSTGGQTADDRSESGDAAHNGAPVEPVEEAPKDKDGQGTPPVVSPPLDTGEHAVKAGSPTADLP